MRKTKPSRRAPRRRVKPTWEATGPEGGVTHVPGVPLDEEPPVAATAEAPEVATSSFSVVKEEVSPALGRARRLANITLSISLVWGLSMLGMAVFGGLGYYSMYNYSMDGVRTYALILLMSWAPAAVAMGLLKTGLFDRVPAFMIVLGMAGGYLAMGGWIAAVLDRWASLDFALHIAALAYVPCLVPSAVYFLGLTVRGSEETQETSASAVQSLPGTGGRTDAPPATCQQPKLQSPEGRSTKTRSQVDEPIVALTPLERAQEGEIAISDAAACQVATVLKDNAGDPHHEAAVADGPPAHAGGNSEASLAAEVPGQEESSGEPIQATRATAGQTYLTTNFILLFDHKAEYDSYSARSLIPLQAKLVVLSPGARFVRVRTEAGVEAFIESKEQLVPIQDSTNVMDAVGTASTTRTEGRIDADPASLRSPIVTAGGAGPSKSKPDGILPAKATGVHPTSAASALATIQSTSTARGHFRKRRRKPQPGNVKEWGLQSSRRDKQLFPALATALTGVAIIIGISGGFLQGAVFLVIFAVALGLLYLLLSRWSPTSYSLTTSEMGICEAGLNRYVLIAWPRVTRMSGREMPSHLGSHLRIQSSTQTISLDLRDLDNPIGFFSEVLSYLPATAQLDVPKNLLQGFLWHLMSGPGEES